jgi:hypothetical protein
MPIKHVRASGALINILMSDSSPAASKLKQMRWSYCVVHFLGTKMLLVTAPLPAKHNRRALLGS